MVAAEDQAAAFPPPTPKVAKMWSTYRNRGRTKPDIHLCSTWCWVRCRLLRFHRRTNTEAKCLCCRRISPGLNQEAARGRKYPQLAIRWREYDAGRDQEAARHSQ